ncbi:MAG: hypothetical protein DRG31_06990 [Deltaproteobacteria bacterium]|nr:MAG: hypothetical protein DRG31_06990 [Deltaproteobacteria bacterium]
MEKQTTASAIISFAEKLEDSSSKFYVKLSEKYEQGREMFMAFAKESEKNKVLIKRTYLETITDAIEACFSFEDLNLQDYLVETDFKKDASYSDALKMAIKLEEKASKFYMDVAKRSESLLATIPRAFKKVAEVRNNRRLKLKNLLNSLKCN